MKKVSILLAVVLVFSLSVIVSAQQNQESQSKGYLQNRLPSEMGSQTFQSYYQNVYGQQQQQFQQSTFPAFDVDKSQLFGKVKEALPLEGAIDPQKYIVGPGDVLQMHVWSSVPFMYSGNVNPEGSFVIPTVGMVKVVDLSLEEAKKKIHKIVRKIYVKGKITTSLVSPRIFSVTVSGVVNNPGNYYASAVQRVDQVIYQANVKSPVSAPDISVLASKNKELLQRNDVMKYYSDDQMKNNHLEFSLRNIKIIRKNSDTLSVDLVRYYATGDKKYDPFLLDGDRIIVPNLSLEGNSLSISGAVRLEGVYEFFSEDSLSSIFEIAQGPTNVADLHHIDLYRTDLETGELFHKVIDFTKIKNKEIEDIALQPNDKIIVRKKYSNKLSNSIRIKGEIKNPGVYPISRYDTPLSEIIQSAGGFTKYASLKEAKIYRFGNTLNKLEQNPDYKRLLEMRMTDMGILDREYYNLEAILKHDLISVDFHKLFVLADSTQDVHLTDGNVIIIPAIKNTIAVLGQIPNPGHLQFVKDKDFRYYIEQAGGTGNKAWIKKVRIIKAGSKNWLKPKQTVLEPGDTIWIPKQREREFNFYFNWASRIIGILASAATIILIAQK